MDGQQPPEHPPVQRLAYFISNLIRVVGLYLAFQDAGDGALPAQNLILYAFMMAGATSLEGIVDRFLPPPDWERERKR